MPQLDPEVEEKIRADERARVSEAMRRAALVTESKLPAAVKGGLTAENLAFMAGGIEVLRHFADRLDAVTRNGGTSDGMEMTNA